MSKKGQLLELKSRRALTDKTVNGNEIAKDRIAFANASGDRFEHILNIYYTPKVGV